MTNDFAIGIAVGIVLFVIIPCIALLVAARYSQPRSEPVDWIAYNNSIRPLYTTLPASSPKRPPRPAQASESYYDGVKVVGVRDWGFAADIYLEDGSVRMVEKVSRSVDPVELVRR